MRAMTAAFPNSIVSRTFQQHGQQSLRINSAALAAAFPAAVCVEGSTACPFDPLKGGFSMLDNRPSTLCSNFSAASSAVCAAFPFTHLWGV